MEEAQKRRDWSRVRRLLIEETSVRRGHRYVTSVVEADTRELLFLTGGATVKRRQPIWSH